MQEVRCRHCNKLLARIVEVRQLTAKIKLGKDVLEKMEDNKSVSDFTKGFVKRIEIACPRCGEKRYVGL